MVAFAEAADQLPDYTLQPVLPLEKVRLSYSATYELVRPNLGTTIVYCP